ncbi:hypothetical protein [Vitiosangium sp. GDMCC 1.1324]|uniref:hypothetical protein n=1 Tax=Vitiosangium sp. (strain GDMCC 1.1324) TaxID=2138576 RepID=UPI0011B567AC|nr:hypothetical protein [Vitiosangium sp. GDMCC 1.1324]
MTASSQVSAAIPYQPIPPLTPLHHTYSASATDHFYTINYAESYYSTQIGYTPQGIAAYLERSSQPTASPFRRYWKGPPQVEHVYLTDDYPDEKSYVLSNGYVAEGIEGYLHIQQVPGSIPLYRLGKFNANTGDLVHIYTSSNWELQTLLSQGWTYDHIAGYVQLTSTFSGIPGTGPDGFPVIPGGHYMARRCGANTGCQSETGFRNYYVGYRSVLSTGKLTGTYRQIMSFDLWSPDYFTASQHEHIAIGLHGQLPLDMSNIDGSTAHHALGILIGESDCGVGATSVRVEAFWPTGNAVSGTCVPNALSNNVTYTFRITVTDAGEISYTVTPKGSTTPIISDSLKGAKLFTDPRYPFPAGKTGYFIVPATLGNADYSLYFTNFSVSWQP